MLHSNSSKTPPASIDRRRAQLQSGQAAEKLPAELNRTIAVLSAFVKQIFAICLGGQIGHVEMKLKTGFSHCEIADTASRRSAKIAKRGDIPITRQDPKEVDSESQLCLEV